MSDLNHYYLLSECKYDNLPIAHRNYRHDSLPFCCCCSHKTGSNLSCLLLSWFPLHWYLECSRALVAACATINGAFDFDDFPFTHSLTYSLELSWRVRLLLVRPIDAHGTTKVCDSNHPCSCIISCIIFVRSLPVLMAAPHALESLFCITQ